MKAERQHKETTSRVIQPSKGSGGHIVDNRSQSEDQTKMIKILNNNFAPNATFDAIQRATDISYNMASINYKYFGLDKSDYVGVNTEAYLDPKDKKKGTGVGLKSGIYSHFGLVQGHLLNADLGGEAISENLFPISQELNKSHSGIEEQVKTLYSKLVVGQRLHYKVESFGQNGCASGPQFCKSSGLKCTCNIEGSPAPVVEGDQFAIELRNPSYSGLPGITTNEQNRNKNIEEQ